MEKKPQIHINPTFQIVGGEDPHAKTERMKKWIEYPQKDVVKKVPLQLDIESTSVCNLRCPMCFQSEEETRPAPAHMSIELFKHVVEEFAKKGGDSLKMMYRGEPLITRDLHKRIKYATDRGLDIRFNTNGVLLTEEKAKEFIEVGTYEIIFSIDSHIPEEYNKIRRPEKNKLGFFDKVLDNVRTLARLKKEMGEKYPMIRISRVDIPETREQAKGFTEFWLKNGADYVSFVDLNDYSLGKDSEVIASEEFCCEQPWQRMFILADGLVTQCCGDIYQLYPLAQLETPSKIKKYERKLEDLKTSQNKPGDKIELKILEEKNQEKWVIGCLQNNRKVKANQMKIRGIAGNIDIVPLFSSVEEAWRGKKSEYIREVNRKGKSHLSNICADCGYRRTVIKNKELNYQKVKSKKNENLKQAKTSYVKKEGLE